MNSALPSKNLNLLKKLLGKRIVSVKRQLLTGDFDLTDYEQNADGPVQIILNDNSALHFLAETESFSISVFEGEMLPYGDSYESRDVSNNSFWTNRIKKRITSLKILRSPDWSDDYPSEFGLEILFDNGKRVLIEYIDEENFPDMLKVTNGNTAQSSTTEQFS